MAEIMQVTNQRYRLGYHLMTPGGWMNDPNGFSFFNGWYHIFYQYYPYTAEWGPMHWGHARSKDLLHWETLPVALAPDAHEDGCFSGSAVAYDGKLWLIYTGHHYTAPGNGEAFYEDQNLAFSEDGIHFEKYDGNPVLRTPADNTKHFRDPKVWQEGETFYMVLGSQQDDGLGRALLYSSRDLKHWERISTLAKAKDVKEDGYMWECPDFFHLDGRDILLMSPQGLAAKGDCFRNLNQTGYLMGDLQRETRALAHGAFEEIDHGHDFYATQTMKTPDGRRVVLAWMQSWDSPMLEKADGWAGALTIPRELRIENGKLFQKPVREMETIRVDAGATETLAMGETRALPRTSEVALTFHDVPTGALFQLTDGEKFLLVSVDRAHRRLIVTRSSADGERAAHFTHLSQLSVRLFLDTSSVEMFAQDGEVTFTERVYWNAAPHLLMLAAPGADAQVYALESDTNRY